MNEVCWQYDAKKKDSLKAVFYILIRCMDLVVLQNLSGMKCFGLLNAV